MPLPALRQVQFEGWTCPASLQTFIAEAGMGAHAKVIAGFNGHHGATEGYDGEVLTNAGPKPVGTATLSSRATAHLTFLLGGVRRALDGPQCGRLRLAGSFAEQWAPLFPNLRRSANSAAWAINWGQERRYGGSYSCLDRGQYTAAIDHLYFEGDEEERQVGFVAQPRLHRRGLQRGLLGLHGRRGADRLAGGQARGRRIGLIHSSSGIRAHKKGAAEAAPFLCKKL